MLFGGTVATEWFTVHSECETIVHIEDYFEVVR
ncbi:hypothetical protein electrica_00876 [Klebsiella electrica]|nr:hypothetical protein electrica_00876 [Klebsiella electrica]BBV74824.1 hypothetical protein STW0522RAO56_08780 [Raoultella planticola]